MFSVYLGATLGENELPPRGVAPIPLTDTAVRNAKPGTKPVRLFDERGLYLEVSPTGGKWWRVKYRLDGKEERLSLGVYPDVGLKDARDRRDAARRLLADGIDPSENRKAQKSARADRVANGFEVVAREWFAKFSTTWATHHGDRIIRRLERDIFPWIGERPISEVTAPELLTVVRRIEGRGALETAHRSLGNCGRSSAFDPRNCVRPSGPTSTWIPRSGATPSPRRTRRISPPSPGKPWRSWATCIPSPDVGATPFLGRAATDAQ